MKLNQLIAISQGSKQKLDSVFKEAGNVFRSVSLFNGRSKKYEANDEEGTDYPSEYEKIQQYPEKILKVVFNKFSSTLDGIAVQDVTNCTAESDVVVDGNTILVSVPAVTLIALSKYLKELQELIRTIPVLDSTVDWNWDEPNGRWVSPRVTKNKTKKIQRPIVLHAPTIEHPAQTAMINEDIVEGKWHEVKHSSALTLEHRNEMIDKIGRLHDAVVLAREAANMKEVIPKKIGEQILKFLGGDA